MRVTLEPGTMKPGKRRSIALAAVGLLLGIGLCIYFATDNRRSAMPTYEGKTAEQWFFGSNSQSQARLAMYLMGTNCVPFLLEKALMSDSMLKKSYYWLWMKLPKSIRPGAPVPPGSVQMLAWSHLGTWSHESDFMQPELLAAIKRVESDAIRYRAMQAMEPIFRRLPRQVREAAYVSFLEDPSFTIRFEAAIQLANHKMGVTNALPVLMNAATNAVFVEREFFETYSPYAKLQSGIPWRQATASNALKRLNTR